MDPQIPEDSLGHGLKSLDSARADHAIVSKIVIETQWHQGNEFHLAILKYLKCIHFFLYFSEKYFIDVYISFPREICIFIQIL